MKKSSFIAAPLISLFLQAHGAFAECGYSPSETQRDLIVADSDDPVLGRHIAFAGNPDAEKIEEISGLIDIDCVFNDLNTDQDIEHIPYLELLPDVKAMMRAEVLRLKPHPQIPADKILLEAQCGQITIEFDPGFFKMIQAFLPKPLFI